MRAAILVLAASAAVLAQTPPATQKPTQQPTFRADVEIGRVVVRVLDLERRPIRGLTEKDFTVLLNGTPQPIVTVVAEDELGPEEPAAPWMRDIASDVAANDLEDPRLLLVIMDGVTSGKVETSKASPYQMKQARDIARAVIDHLGPNDLASITFTGDNREPQDFTRDRAKLLAAVDRYHPQEVEIRMVAPMQRTAIRTALEFLRQAPERRSAIIWISDSLPGADDNILPLQVKPAPPTTPGAPTLQAGSTSVPVYFVNTQGFTGREVPRDHEKTIPGRTGGRTYGQNNTPVVFVPEIFRELSVSYTIGFQPTEPYSDGRFKRVQVRVNRPDVMIFPLETGFFPVNPKHAAAAKAAAAKTASTSLALSGLIPVTDEPLRLTLAPFAAAGADAKSDTPASVAVALGVDIPFESRTPEPLDVEIRVFDGEGRKQLDRQRLTQTLRPRGGRDHTEFELLATLSLKPGRYNIRVATFSQGRESAGSVFTDVTVPEFAKEDLSLSGAVVSLVPGKTAMPADEFRAWLPVAPTTTRAFAQNDLASVYLRVYTPSDRPEAAVPVRAEIRSGRDEVVFSQTDSVTPKTSGPLRSAAYNLRLPLATLAPGQYVVSIAAGEGEKAVRRDVRFSVLR